ncbi:MAG: DUF3999 domain-containing protein, partial [Burkholderiales bacterium]
EDPGDDALYRIVITPAVYQGVAYADLRDLRVFNGDNEIVPHAFRPLVARRERPAPVTLPFFPLRGKQGTTASDLDISLETKDGEISLRATSRSTPGESANLLGYLIDLSSHREAFSELILDWTSRPSGYSGSVSVEASDDLKNWSRIVRDAPLLSLSRGGQMIERRTVSLPGRKHKYLRLTWPDGNETLDLISISAQPVDKRTAMQRDFKQVDATADPRRQGDYVADLGGLFPVDRVTIHLPQDNSVAPMQVYSRNSPDADWRLVISTVAYRLRQDGDVIENDAISISARAHRYWLFRVDQQGGGIGEGTIRVRAGWVAREIIFAARGPKPFRLAFGNSRAQQNALPVTKLVPNWGTDNAPKIELSATGSAETLAGPAAARKRLDTKKAGLWLALFVGVGVLGLMAWRISRQMNLDDE